MGLQFNGDSIISTQSELKSRNPLVYHQQAVLKDQAADLGLQPWQYVCSSIIESRVTRSLARPRYKSLHLEEESLMAGTCQHTMISENRETATVKQDKISAAF